MSFLSAVAVGGIALGVAALLVALAGLSGLQHALRAEVLGRTSEIEIEAPYEEIGPLIPRLSELGGVESVSRRLRGTGWILVAGSVRPVELVGFEGLLPASFPTPSGRSPGLYIAARLAALYGLVQGDRVELASARPALSPIGPLPRLRRLALAGTFDGGVLDRRETLALPLEQAVDLLGRGSLYLVVSAGGLDEALEVTPGIQAILPATARLRTWQDLNAPLLFALQLEKRLMFVAVFLIVMVGALALVSDLSLIIASRRFEIGILGTMGAAPATLRKAFLALGALLGGLGVVLGTALGTSTAAILDRWELIRLPGDAYLLDHVPFRLEAADAAMVVGATLMIALACAWFGVSRVASMRPVEALRT